MREYQIFDITFDPAEDLGLGAVSFVDMPAIEQNFVYFSDRNEMKPCNVSQGSLIMANIEKHEVISPILIPNQLILRLDEQGNKYYVRWSKETIQKVAQYYVANQYLNNFTIQHSWFETQNGNYTDSFIKDVYCLKFWIIEDSKTDEINKKYGYHLPEGTLCVHLKIHNRKLWQRIKSGELKGLSIEAFVGQQNTSSIKLSKNINNMKKNNFKLKLAKIVAKYNEVVDELKDLEKLAEGDSVDAGEVSLKYYTDGDDFIEVLSDGTALASDGSVIEDGEYPLLDGGVLVVEEGKFKETIPADEATEEPEEAPISEAKDDEEEKTEEEPKEETPEEEPKDEEDEDKKKEETQEEEEIPYTLVDIEIDGETYQVPQPVFDYIKSLEGSNETFHRELAKMQARVPSIKPVVVKQNKNDENGVVFSVIEKLNRK